MTLRLLRRAEGETEASWASKISAQLEAPIRRVIEATVGTEQVIDIGLRILGVIETERETEITFVVKYFDSFHLEEMEFIS